MAIKGHNIRIFGIENCENVRSAICWLKENNITYEFFNLKLNKIDDHVFRHWLKLIDISKIINKRSKTWRNLAKKEKIMLENPVSAVDTVTKFPLILKRPILQINDQEIIIGFSIDSYSKKFRKQK